MIMLIWWCGCVTGAQKPHKLLSSVELQENHTSFQLGNNDSGEWISPSPWRKCERQQGHCLRPHPFWMFSGWLVSLVGFLSAAHRSSSSRTVQIYARQHANGRTPIWRNRRSSATNHVTMYPSKPSETESMKVAWRPDVCPGFILSWISSATPPKRGPEPGSWSADAIYRLSPSHQCHFMEVFFNIWSVTPQCCVQEPAPAAQPYFFLPLSATECHCCSAVLQPLRASLSPASRWRDIIWQRGRARQLLGRLSHSYCSCLHPHQPPPPDPRAAHFLSLPSACPRNKVLLFNCSNGATSSLEPWPWRCMIRAGHCG